MAQQPGSDGSGEACRPDRRSNVRWMACVLYLASIVLLIEAALAWGIAITLSGEMRFVWRAVAAVVLLAIGVVGLLAGVVAFAWGRWHRWGSAGILAGAIVVSLFPYLQSTGRELALRGTCRYGLAFLVTYVIRPDANGRFPGGVHDFLAAHPHMEQQVVCPAGESGDVAGAFIYIPNQTIADDPRNVLLYERPGRHRGFGHADGGHVLYLDMHHEWVEPYSRVVEMVEQTKRRLAAEAPQSALASRAVAGPAGG